uniref:Uncharacterized protein n=1 Tax=Mycetohabitans sp. TaxID=2571162 RepID=A0A6B9HDA5_9BURK|nr:hypothetical protein [Mycetohabitans sp.]
MTNVMAFTMNFAALLVKTFTIFELRAPGLAATRKHSRAPAKPHWVP